MTEPKNYTVISVKGHQTQLADAIRADRAKVIEAIDGLKVMWPNGLANNYIRKVEVLHIINSLPIGDEK